MQKYFKNDIVTTIQQWNQQQLHLAPSFFQHYHHNYNDKTWKSNNLNTISFWNVFTWIIDIFLIGFFMKKSIMQLFLYHSFYLLSIIQRYSLSNLTENVRSRLHPVPHFFFRKNIDYSFNLLLQFTDTSFMCQLFIQNTFSFIISSCFLSWMSKSSISTLATYFFDKISKNLF